MSVESRILELKTLITPYERYELQTFIAGLLLQVGKVPGNQFLKKLMSPQRQLFFLAILNLQQEDLGTKKGFTEVEWDSIVDLLCEVEAEYIAMLGWPKDDSETSEHTDVIMIAMSSYMTYHFNGPLFFAEQEIERIETVFKPFETEIALKTGLEIGDFIMAFDLLEETTKTNLEDALFYVNQTNRQKLVLKGLMSGLDTLEEMMELDAEKIAAMQCFMTNPGAILRFRPEKLPVHKLSTDKLIKVLKLFTYEPEPKSSLHYYTDDNILFRKPFLQLPNGQYLMFFLKQYLNAIYLYLWDLCSGINKTKLTTHRDACLENKVARIFDHFFDKKAHIYANYKIVYNGAEQDILLLYKGKALIIEAKALAIRAPMRDPFKAFDKIKSDFKASIQYGYNQCYRVKSRFLNCEDFSIYNERGEIEYTVPVRQYKDVYSIIVTRERYGMIQTDLDNMLKVENNDQYPWSISIDDLEAFLLCLKKSKMGIDKLFSYLFSREKFHGRLFCSDELEMCGQYLTDPKLFSACSLADNIFYVDPHLSTVIDQEYYSGLGFKNERHFKQKRRG
jgi:hypothetical protein